MTAATFGDFLCQAGTHLDGAAGIRQDATANPADAVPALHRLVATLARYLDDQVPFHAIDVTRRTGLAPWDRAVIDACTTMVHAADSLSQPAGQHDPPHPEPDTGPAGHLAAAATCLDAGRDLLHTHATITPADLWEPRSPWAHAVISTPVRRALTGEVARWSRQLAPLASALADCTGQLPAVRGALQSATRWLWMADAAIQSAQATQPVTADDRRLLHAIPAAHPPGRCPPDGHELAAELCAGITISAERLRATVFGTADHARWAPESTADTWRWTARAAAITSHASELLLRSLAGDLSQPATPAPVNKQLAAAADTVARSQATWRQVTSAWNDLTTETRGHNASALADIGDLVLRTGRLAWDDPQWTPATGPGVPRRPVTDLTGRHPGLPAVLGAIHQTADALACIPARDRAAVHIADRAERLYVRTRSLPLNYDVPRRYATAPADRVQPLLHAYTAAEQASAQAADVLAALAITLQAPSQPLALARTAAHRHHSTTSPSADQQDIPDTPQAAEPRACVPDPGPVEQAIRDLHVSDPAILRRAAEIDTAAQTLITQAQQISRHLGPRANRQRPAQRPSPAVVRLTAADNPCSSIPRRPGSKNPVPSTALRRPRSDQASRSPRP